MVPTPSLALPPAGNRWRPPYGTVRLLPAPKGRGKIRMKKKKARWPVLAIVGVSREEVPGCDAERRLWLAGDGHPRHTLTSSTWERNSGGACELCRWGTSAWGRAPKNRGPPAHSSGLLPASQPALAAEALFFRRSVPSPRPCPQGVAGEAG